VNTSPRRRLSWSCRRGLSLSKPFSGFGFHVLEGCHVFGMLGLLSNQIRGLLGVHMIKKIE
jgi:hypothetical protein